ncbi:MAG: hypothetical protein E7280_00335 [Lachnospiraceae bacterium]|jgi:GNAT superfamily N-acetyltransferase|nr:hypothetical protein [Lachnospiraceae bacterium]
MTDPDYRKQGLAAKLMKRVIEDYEKEYDGADDYRFFLQRGYATVYRTGQSVFSGLVPCIKTAVSIEEHYRK